MPKYGTRNAAQQEACQKQRVGRLAQKMLHSKNHAKILAQKMLRESRKRANLPTRCPPAWHGTC
jgi:hypothetical protein